MDNDNIVEDKLLTSPSSVSGTSMNDWNQLARKVQQSLSQGDHAKSKNIFREIQYGTAETLLHLVRSKVPNEEDAKDIMGRIYMDFYRALEKPEPMVNVTAFLNVVATRRVADFWRKQSGSGADSRTAAGEWRSREVTTDTVFWDKQADKAGAADFDITVATDDRLFAEKMAPLILERLRPELRDVLIKRHIEQLSVAETSLALGISADVVKKRNQAAIKEARQFIDDETRIPS